MSGRALSRSPPRAAARRWCAQPLCHAHLAPGNPVHPELAAFAARHGYQVAYDGLSLRCVAADSTI